MLDRCKVSKKDIDFQTATALGGKRIITMVGILTWVIGLFLFLILIISSLVPDINPILQGFLAAVTMFMAGLVLERLGYWFVVEPTPWSLVLYQRPGRNIRYRFRREQVQLQIRDTPDGRHARIEIVTADGEM